MAAVLALAPNSQYEFQIRPLLDSLEEDFPEQVASTRAYILIRNSSQREKISKCDAALRILTAALSGKPNSAQLLYNAAYIAALKHDKETSFSYVQQSLKIEPNNPQAILLLLRILRANCQYKKVIQVVDSTKHILDHSNKYITIEAMFAASESGTLNKTEELFQKVQKHWQTDPYALSAAVKLNFLLGKPQSAAECFQHWAEHDRQSPEFFFCFAQLCLASKDYGEAEKFLLYAVELAPTCGEYHASLATLLFKNGKNDKAKERAKFAIQVDPLSVHSWIALSMVTSGNESTEAAEKAAQLRKTSVDLNSLQMMLFSKDHKDISDHLH